MTSKENLKDVFSGVSSVMFEDGGSAFSTTGSGSSATTTITMDPDFDLPVHVDDLTLNEGEPTVNHYKVFGLDTDWVSTSEKGDFTLSMVIPTLHEDVLGLVYGDDSVSSVTGSLASGSWSGTGIKLSAKQVKGTVIIMNQAKDRLLIISNASLWPSLVFENGSTDPVAIRLSGTIEASEHADVVYLKKTT